MVSFVSLTTNMIWHGRKRSAAVLSLVLCLVSCDGADGSENPSLPAPPAIKETETRLVLPPEIAPAAVADDDNTSSKLIVPAIASDASQEIEKNETAKNEDSSDSASVNNIKKPQREPLKLTSQQQAVHLGALLALNSGLINGYCLSGLILPTKQAVTAVTGAWTNWALGTALLDSKLAWGQTALIASYFGGSTLYGLLNPRPEALILPRGPVSWALLLSSASLVAAGVIALLVTKEDTEASYWHQYLVFSLAALASGIQNSLTSCHSSNLVRTTHYSGMSSDMGTFWGQALRGNHENSFKLQSFVKLSNAYWVGGTCAVLGAKALNGGGWCFLVSALVPLILSILVRTAKIGAAEPLEETTAEGE